MRQHPLDLPDPDRHPGEFGGVRVQFDPQHAFRPNHRKGPGEPQGLGLQDDPVFQVLEPQQGQQQEVAGAAGRVQDPEVGEAGQEAL